MNWEEAGQKLPAKENLYFIPDKVFESYIAVYRSSYKCLYCKNDCLMDSMAQITTRMLEDTDYITLIIKRLMSHSYSKICCGDN